jgi:hypothetical protein
MIWRPLLALLTECASWFAYHRLPRPAALEVVATLDRRWAEDLARLEPNINLNLEVFLERFGPKVGRTD